MAEIKDRANTEGWRGGGKTGSPLHCWWECKMVRTPRKAVWHLLKNRTCTYHRTQPSHSGQWIPEEGGHVHTTTCTHALRVVSFTGAPNGKPAQCPATREGYTVVRTCRGKLLSREKELTHY